MDGEDEEGGVTAFMACAGAGEKELCELLVGKGADPAAKRKDGATALHIAAGRGLILVCEYLIESCGLGIDAIATNPQGYLVTPLFNASLGGHTELCGYLLEKGAIVDSGYQPLMIAAQVSCFYLMTLEWP